MKDDDSSVTLQEDLENEVIQFYSKLLGQSSGHWRGLDIVALRNGKQLSRDQCQHLIRPIAEEEITNGFKSLGDRKAPGLDGYNAKFFKHTWSIVGTDVIKAVKFYQLVTQCHPIYLYW